MTLPPEPTAADFGVTAKDLALAERFKNRETTAWLVVFGIFSVLSAWQLAEEFHPLAVVIFAPFVGAAFAVYPGMPIIWLGWYCVRKLTPSLARVERLEKARKEYRIQSLRLARDFWLGLRGRAFEVQLANVLSGLGYRTELTPASGDGGVDLVVTIGEQRVIIQCKAQKKPAGPAVVRELYGTLQTSGAAHAVLAAPMGWTAGAQKYCSGLPISLWDVGRIVEIAAGRPLFKGAAETDLK